MVVDQPASLRKGVDDGGAAEAEAFFLQVLGDLR